MIMLFSCMNLSVCWLNVNENALNENDSYSDLDPLSAPKWFLSFTFHDDTKHLLCNFSVLRVKVF